MDPQVWAAIVGAVVGAVLAGAAGILVWFLQEVSATKHATRGARVDLAREIIRFRGDQTRLLGPLNELPILFAEDKEVMRLYRSFLDGAGRDQTLTDIVVRMAKEAGAKDIDVSDVQRVLHIPTIVPVPPTNLPAPPG